MASDELNWGWKHGNQARIAGLDPFCSIGPVQRWKRQWRLSVESRYELPWVCRPAGGISTKSVWIPRPLERCFFGVFCAFLRQFSATYLLSTAYK